MPFINEDTLNQTWPDEWSGKSENGLEGLRRVSPAEHQATPDKWHKMGDSTGEHYAHYYSDGWDHPELHGNLPGWVQHRKLLPGEAVAPLPEGYTP